MTAIDHTWGCICGKVYNVPYLSDVRRSLRRGLVVEYHGPFYCESVRVSDTGKVLERRHLWPE